MQLIPNTLPMGTMKSVDKCALVAIQVLYETLLDLRNGCCFSRFTFAVEHVNPLAVHTGGEKDR